MPSTVVVETTNSINAKHTHAHTRTSLTGHSPATPSTPIHTSSSTMPTPSPEQQPTEWGRNFWVTLVDPQTGTQFYACPSTGETTWDAPVGSFVLPPSSEGEWWELADETRNGLPYYYHTQRGETTWEKPEGFVIPLGVIQNTSLGRKLSQSTRRNSRLFADQPTQPQAQLQSSPSTPRRTTGSQLKHIPPSVISERTEEISASTSASGSGSGSDRRTPPRSKPSPNAKGPSTPSPSRPSSRTRTRSSPHVSPTRLPGPAGSQSLTAAVEYIAGSADRETSSAPGPDGKTRRSPSRSRERERGRDKDKDRERERERIPPSPSLRSVSSPAQTNGKTPAAHTHNPPPSPKTKTHSPHVHPQMLSRLSFSFSHGSEHGHGGPAAVSTPTRKSPMSTPPYAVIANVNANNNNNNNGWIPRPRRNTNAAPVDIGRPILDLEATKAMSPIIRKINNIDGTKAVQPVPVETKRLSTGDHPLLPRELVFEIQQFAQSDFAKRYFSTHRQGFIRRRVPVEKMMTWQKPPLTSPLLTLPKPLHKDAVRSFKIIQRIMGDRDRDRSDAKSPAPHTLRHTDSAASLRSSASSSHTLLLEDQRALLSSGLANGEMRDEIYCQLIKQLNGNPSTESAFRGWQFMCVVLVTFPPSKNFEMYVRAFMQQRVGQTEGRVDVMAKYCLGRLTMIAKKGPRGKAPTVQEIEVASDAAFNPSTFGESLDAVFRLQARTYPSLKIPIILPFLADGILALGGTKSEGIFRIPGDADAVSDLRLRIDKGVYTLDAIDDPHVPAGLFKLWLRELREPLIPNELYNDCIECAGDPEKVVEIVRRLPGLHRRVMLFVVSFLQLFLEERIVGATKMTAENLALVMAPNLLRCASENMGVVFTNAQYEQKFVLNLLLHLRCDQVDPDYAPEHGKGAVVNPSNGHGGGRKRNGNGRGKT
ncbi:hypothetical protein M422DRAFT_776995 [Sphaerobolus stellatus SS14]|nr:hypothetical protein M422DRAFT_776995 [Sphaerobolus stellatus SS14]